MKSNIKIYLAILFIGFSLRSQGQIVSLDSVLRAIQINNHMIHEYDWKIEAMKAYSEGAKSWMAPMAGGGTFMMAYPGSNIMEERDKGSLMVTIQQEIPNPSKLKAKQEYFDSRAAVEESGRSITFNQLRAEAKKVYYQWIISEKKLSVLKENEAIMKMMMKLAEIRYPYAQGSLGNIYKAEGRLHEAQNMIQMTEVELEQKNVLLNTLMNIDTKIRYKIDTGIIVTNPTTDLDTMALITNRSDIRLANSNIASMKLNSRLMSLESKPNFNLRYDHMSPLGKGMPQMFTAMVMVSIPIAPWSSKMYKSQVKGMNNEITAMEMEREGILSEARGMVLNMAKEIKKMELQLGNYKTKIIPALKRNYEVEMLAYEENKSQLPTLIDAWEAMNMVQMEYLNKLEELYLMVVNYEKELDK